MLRQLVRLGVLATALVSALAFSGSALAGPTTPQLDPIPDYVFGPTLTVKWSPSFFDRGALFTGYRVDVSDLTTGTLRPPVITQATQATLLNLQSAHKYVVRVRALEITSNLQVLLSPTDADVFTVLPVLRFDDIYEVVYKFPPDPPWCLTCPYFELVWHDDPVLRSSLDRIQVLDTERLVGVYVDARGEVRGISG